MISLSRLRHPQRAGGMCRARLRRGAISHRKTGLDGPVIVV